MGIILALFNKGMPNIGHCKIKLLLLHKPMIVEEIKRHCNPSVFLKKELEPEAVGLLLRAGLLFATEDAQDSLELYVTDNGHAIERLADAREDKARAILGAPLVVAVTADRLYDGAWIENSSRSVWMMCAQAASMKISYSVVQIRGYALGDGTLADDVVCGILDIPENKTIYALVAFGYAAEHGVVADAESLGWERIHIGENGKM